MSQSDSRSTEAISTRAIVISWTLGILWFLVILAALLVIFFSMLALYRSVAAPSAIQEEVVKPSSESLAGKTPNENDTAQKDPDEDGNPEEKLSQTLEIIKNVIEVLKKGDKGFQMTRD